MRALRHWGIEAALGAALLAGLLALVAVVALVRAPALIDLPGTRTIDRSGPAVLKAIAPLGPYRAATANMEVIVELEQGSGSSRRS